MGKRRDDGEQTVLPGTETTKDKHIHAMAKKYRRLIAERLELQEEESTAHDKLVGAMEAKGIEVYEIDGVTVNIKQGKKKAKVTVDEYDKKDKGNE